jgi:ribosomal protein S18 acetylase RimI-like enzyme
MAHLLDNPIFNALATGNSNLAYGNAQVKHFDAEVAIFVGLQENTAANFQLLYDAWPQAAPAIFVATYEVTDPASWTLAQSIPGLQMVYEGETKFVDESNLVVLTEEHAAQMVALATLTNPGPFFSKTIAFGHYRGVFNGDKLVAMAGQRLNPLPYAEISAVCTHPDHTGKGHANQLLQFQINRIKAEGNIPFLHVKGDNERAIKIYEKMGFKTRSQVYFHILKK